MRSSSLFTAVALVASAAAHGILELLEDDKELSILLKAVKAVPGLADTLSATQGITVFAPTNEAFKAVDEDSLEGKAIAKGDIDGIASILSYHVVPTFIYAANITAAPQFVQTLLTSKNVFDGKEATLVTGGQYLGAQLVKESVTLTSGLLAKSVVTEADIGGDSGALVHKIDSVLTIPRAASVTAETAEFTELVSALDATNLTATVDAAADVTVFIPTNPAFEAIADTTATLSVQQLSSVLTLHVAPGVLYSPDIPMGQTPLPTLNGEQLKVVNNGTIAVNQAKVVMPDVVLKNGVGHVIDSVLLPSSLIARRHRSNARV